MFRILFSVVFAVSLSLVSTAHVSAEPTPVGETGAVVTSFSVHSAGAAAEAHELWGGVTCTSPTLNVGGGHLSCHVDVGPVVDFFGTCGFEPLPRRTLGRSGALCLEQAEPPLRPPQVS
ncbi:MAG TPA: hypothetical protein ENJ90_08725 [Devosia sp.]|nr:hypothetical protein [Devosia sp.]